MRKIIHDQFSIHLSQIRYPALSCEVDLISIQLYSEQVSTLG